MRATVTQVRVWVWVWLVVVRVGQATRPEWDGCVCEGR
jgi:hypothetical protein